MRLIRTHFSQLAAFLPDSMVENRKAPHPPPLHRLQVSSACLVPLHPSLSAIRLRINRISADRAMFLVCLDGVAQLSDGCTGQTLPGLS